MKNQFASMVILITAAVYAGFAAWLGWRPGALLTAFGIEESTPQMLTEIRAFYGGIELGIAATMLILWRRGELFAALLIGGLPLAGSATGRWIGMSIDGPWQMHTSLALLEAVGSVFCFAGCLMVRNSGTQPAEEGES